MLPCFHPFHNLPCHLDPFVFTAYVLTSHKLHSASHMLINCHNLRDWLEIAVATAGYKIQKGVKTEK